MQNDGYFLSKIPQKKHSPLEHLFDRCYMGFITVDPFLMKQNHKEHEGHEGKMPSHSPLSPFVYSLALPAKAGVVSLRQAQCRPSCLGFFPPSTEEPQVKGRASTWL